MIDYKTLPATVNPGHRDLSETEIRELRKACGNDCFRLIELAFLLGFQRGRRAGKEEK